MFYLAALLHVLTPSPPHSLPLSNGCQVLDVVTNTEYWDQEAPDLKLHVTTTLAPPPTHTKATHVPPLTELTQSGMSLFNIL